MSSEQHLPAMTRIIRALFDEYDGPVTPELSARDVPQWDSLSNVQLMVLAEKEFGVRFTTSEIQHADNLGDLMALIDKKRS